MAELTRGDLNYLDILTQRGVSQDRQYELLNKARAKKGLQPVQEQSGAASLAYKFTKGLASTGKGIGQLSRLLPGDQKADQNSFYNRYNRDFESVFGEDKLSRQKALNPNVSGGGVAEFVGGALPTAVASMGLSAGLNLGVKGLATVAPKTAKFVKPFVSLGTKPSYKDVAKFGAFEGLKDQAIYDVGTTGKTSAGSLAVGTAAGGLLGPAFMGVGKMISKGRQATGQINKSKVGAYTEPLSNLTNLQRRLDKTYRVDPTKYVEFQKMTGGKTIGQFAAERGVVDTPEEAVIQFTQRGRKSMEEADLGLDAIQGNFKNDKLQKALIDLRDEAIAAEDDALGELASNLVRKHDSTGLTMKEINEAKRLYEKNNKFNYLRANDAKAYRRATNLDDAIREFQFKQADLNGFPELRAINKETQANFAAANAIQNKLTKQLGNNEFGLTDWIVASGAMQNPQALGALLGKKFMSSAEGQKLYNKLLQYFDKTPQVTPPVANVENIGKMQTFKNQFNDGIPRLSPPLSNSKSADRLIPDEVILPTGGTGKPTVKGPYPSADPTITSRSKIVKPGTYTETPVKKEVQATVIPKSQPKAKLRTNEDALKLPKTPQEGKTVPKEILDEMKKYNNAEDFAKGVLKSGVKETKGLGEAKILRNKIEDIKTKALGLDKSSPEFAKLDKDFGRLTKELSVIDGEDALTKVLGKNEYDLEKNIETLKKFYNDNKPKPSLPLSQKSEVKYSDLASEAKKYKSGSDFYERATGDVRKKMKEEGIRYKSQYEEFFDKNVKTPKLEILDTVNPTGSLYVDYTPQKRANSIISSKDLTTLDKTLGKSPDDYITIYRGTVKGQKEMNPGDFVTDMPELAKAYAGGDKIVISKRVKYSDILDSIEDGGANEYLYIPKEMQKWDKPNKK